MRSPLRSPRVFGFVIAGALLPFRLAAAAAPPSVPSTPPSVPSAPPSVPAAPPSVPSAPPSVSSAPPSAPTAPEGPSPPVLIAPGERAVTLIATPTGRVTVPAGRFVMGAGPDELKSARALCTEELRQGGALLLDVSPRCGARFDAEAPAVEVFVPAFAIDRTEVTVAAYRPCVEARVCAPPPGMRLYGDGRLPVERVTWMEAMAYCRFRGGRLPTEAEWERAARGVGPRPWPWGATWSRGLANHGRAEQLGPALLDGSEAAQAADDPTDDSDGYAGPAPVGAFARGESPHGLVDMAGNVWEWTNGWFSRDPPQSLQRFDPRGPTHGSERTIRGGSYRTPPSDLRVTRRMGLAPTERAAGVGFRCAYDVPRPSPGASP